jgi:hypothetical protein
MIFIPFSIETIIVLFVPPNLRHTHQI